LFKNCHHPPHYHRLRHLLWLEEEEEGNNKGLPVVSVAVVVAVIVLGVVKVWVLLLL